MIYEHRKSSPFMTQQFKLVNHYNLTIYHIYIYMIIIDYICTYIHTIHTYVYIYIYTCSRYHFNNVFMVFSGAPLLGQEIQMMQKQLAQSFRRLGVWSSQRIFEGVK